MQVVALDVGDAHRDAEPVGQLPYGVGESGRVEPARVGDDPDAPLVGEAEALLQLPQEGAWRSRRRGPSAGRGRG